jgi:hypothetical protein
MNVESWKTWFRRRGPSWGVSLIVHLVILAAFALVTWVVITGQTPEDQLVRLAPPVAADEEADTSDSPQGRDRGADAGPQPDRIEPLRADLSLPAIPAPRVPPVEVSELLDAMSIPSVSTPVDPLESLGETLAKSDQPGFGGMAGLEGASQGFGDEIGRLRASGLEIVLVLDATDSMGPYIEQAKQRLREILNVVTRLVPSARFGVVAYKDYGDDYGIHAVRFLKITDDVKSIREFLDNVVAGGGGDAPEPIQEALQVATSFKRMGWHPRRKKVILLVGDSPIHASGRSRAFKLAGQFAVRPVRGTINVIDVGGAGDQGAKRTSVQPDLKRIAESGGGHSFLLRQREEFWRYLIVSVFGQRFKNDVDMIIQRYTQQENPK